MTYYRTIRGRSQTMFRHCEVGMTGKLPVSEMLLSAYAIELILYRKILTFEKPVL